MCFLKSRLAWVDCCELSSQLRPSRGESSRCADLRVVRPPFRFLYLRYVVGSQAFSPTSLSEDVQLCDPFKRDEDLPLLDGGGGLAWLPSYLFSFLQRASSASYLELARPLASYRDMDVPFSNSRTGMSLSPFCFPHSLYLLLCPPV